MSCFLGRNEGFVDRSLKADLAPLLEAEFEKKALARISDHGVSAPIFSSHLLKTFHAVKEEGTHLPEPSRTFLQKACLRFLEAPIKQKHVQRNMRQAYSLVGKSYTSSLQV